MYLKFCPKTKVTDKNVLSVVYTPGIASVSKKIAENKVNSFIYTNRVNTVGVFSDNYEKSLQRAVFLKKNLNIDAVPLVIEHLNILQFVLFNLQSNFNAYDITQIPVLFQNISENSIEIPILKENIEDIEILKTFFRCKNFRTYIGIDKIEGNSYEKALMLRFMGEGSITSKITEEEHKKPVAVISNGTAVLGLGNIGDYGALPVMEGKSVLFSAFADLSAVPICVRTQDKNEFIKVVSEIAKSFSAINLEDIAQPDCFEIEKTLNEKLDIPLFHDDAQGTAIIVLAGLFNALKLVNKNLSDVKIVVCGAGAAGATLINTMLDAGAENILALNSSGIINRNTKYESKYLNELALKTNKDNVSGGIKEAIKGADVFIGVSAPDVLSAEDVSAMNNKPIVFALANPKPEIMPDEAFKGGAYVVATGRSDFPNQINNCLVFPGLFKAMLDNNLNKITPEIKIACSKAISKCVMDDNLSANNIIPSVFDESVVSVISTVLQELSKDKFLSKNNFCYKLSL